MLPHSTSDHLLSTSTIQIPGLHGEYEGQEGARGTLLMEQKHRGAMLHPSRFIFLTLFFRFHP